MTSQRPSFFSLCSAEPFRIYFPLATLLGISGVSLWPLFFSGLHNFYPGPMHARLMIEGFLAGFVFGFLGTALPRLLSAPPLRRATTRCKPTMTTARRHGRRASVRPHCRNDSLCWGRSLRTWTPCHRSSAGADHSPCQWCALLPQRSMARWGKRCRTPTRTGRSFARRRCTRRSR